MKKMQFVQCKECEHFRMWEGDPCCLEPQEGWKIVLPDTMTVCDRFVEANKNFVDWGQVWDVEKKDFFKRHKLRSELFNKYIKEHPEYIELIEKVD